MMVVQHIFELNEETGSKLTYIIYRFYSWFISSFYGASLMRFLGSLFSLRYRMSGLPSPHTIYNMNLPAHQINFFVALNHGCI
jgi:hypothetical protein